MRKFLLLKMLPLFLMLITSMAWAQERTVTGRIISSEDGSALPGVNVVLKGTTTGTVSDADGNYTLSVPSSGGILTFSFIGLSAQEVVIGERATINLTMSQDITQLSEVVVTGYGTFLKKEFSGTVASVGSKDIAKLPLLSASQALQGQAAGVFVTSNSGSPGGGISVRVRGQTSVSAGNDPFYVVDGVPIQSANLTQNGLGGQVQNTLAGLNPQDIEEIQVLKDAANTAIYGARAANGVVLITTKRGKTGGTQINLSAWTGVSDVTKTVNKISAQEWVDLNNEARVNDGLAPLPNSSPPLPAPQVPSWGWDGKTNTDWIKEVFRSARTNEYQLNISGGDEKTRYYFSGSFRDEESTLIGSSYKRGTGRLNLDHKASKLFQFGTSLSVSSELNNRINNDNNIFGVYSVAILNLPTTAVRDENGKFVDGIFLSNPVRDAVITRNENKTLKIIGNFYTNIHLTDGLDFKTDFSYDYNALTEDNYSPVSSAEGRGSNGSGQFSYRQVGTFVIEPTLRYAKVFGADHSFNAVLGGTIQGTRDFRNDAQGNGFARESLTYLLSAATITAGSSFRTENTFQSVFARAGYTFKEKYIASATIRNDASSRFGSNNRNSLFYAGSLGWNFSDESFMKGLNWLSLGKLKASYGTTGNSNIGDFPYQGVFSGNSNYLDRPAFSPLQIGNPDLKWETTAVLDLGIELGLFQNRVNLTANYFNRQTTDLLFASPVPFTTGFGSVQKNIGASENKGFEFELGGTVLNIGDFKWTASSNITFLESKLLKLVDDKPIPQGFASVILAGSPLSSFYGLKFLGVDPGTGQSIFDDLNGDGQITQLDNQIIGNANPKSFGGFTNRFSYKGLSLDVFFQFSAGNDVYNSTQTFSLVPGNGFGTTTEIRRRWKKPGDITDIPRATRVAGNDGVDNSRFVSDGSYLRLKNITLSYDIPKAIVQRAKFRSVRLFVTGENLLTFTGYSGADPEVSTFANTSTSAGTDFLTQPQSKRFNIGINLGF